MEQAYSILHNHLTIPYWLSLLALFLFVFAVWKVVAKKKWTQSFLISLFVTYIFFILLITLIARTPADARKAELIPFWSWYEVIVNHSTSLAVEIGLNVVLFVPVGILSRLQNIGVKRVLLFSLCLSLCIEVTQYFTCRGLCEIFDDVIHNTVGACIGWVVCDRIVPLIKKRYRKALNLLERTIKKHSAKRKPM
ncbi:MAG: VanZ family protein [Clostridiales bacterium]|nr:VanZ family protein [Clostridiales bacterium]